MTDLAILAGFIGAVLLGKTILSKVMDFIDDRRQKKYEKEDNALQETQQKLEQDLKSAREEVENIKKEVKKTTVEQNLDYWNKKK